MNKDHLAPTGKTPARWSSRGVGPTDLHRSIQQQDDRTDNTICQGC
jgi:hypothetical protein